MSFKISYSPISEPRAIYHRAGWSFVIQELMTLFPNREGGEVKLIDLVDDYYLNPKSPPINQPWIGFIHHVPKGHSNGSLELTKLLMDKRFKRSLFYCKILIVFSDYLANYLTQQKGKFLYFPNVIPLKHPTPLDLPLFDLSRFLAKANEAKLIFIGNQDRRLDRFGQTVSPYPKLWLSGYDSQKSFELLVQKLENTYDSGVWRAIETKRVSDEEYDLLLTENLVMVDLLDSSVNNTILECIARNTPIFVNAVGGVVEYLGIEYPLYFKSLEELNLKLGQTELIVKAHHYLVARTDLKEAVSLDRFRKSLLDSLNTKTKPST